MIKFFKSIFAFIPICLGLYCILLLVFGDLIHTKFYKNLHFYPGAYGHTLTRLKSVKNTKDVDVLFLGSSHAYRGFDTRIFKNAGLTSFNLGSSSQTPRQINLLLQRYLDQLNPKLIIFEVYPGTFTSDGVESSLDIIANDYVDWNMIKMGLGQLNIKIINGLIYGLYNQFLNRSFYENVVKDEDTYIPGGFVEKKLKYFKYKDYKNKTWEINAKQLAIFESIIELFKEKDINYILVQAPVTPRLYSSYKNNFDYDQIISEYGKYYNFNELMSLDDSLYFYDNHHLNQNGVELFNKKLLEYLPRIE